MKDDSGEHTLSDAEGYEFKGIQVSGELAAEDLGGVPLIFYNVESDDLETVRNALFGQLTRMRKEVEERLFELCAAAQEIISNHEAKALNAAIEEVANRHSNFLDGNRTLGTRERLAHAEAINTVKSVLYASTLWASTRCCGEYTGLNIVHQVGVGAARDAHLRCESWFQSLDAFLKALKADNGLALAIRSINQIGKSAEASKIMFLEAAQRAGTDVYREPLTQAPIWPSCVSEWGQGPGFKGRVAGHLEEWFSSKSDLKETLERALNGLWDQHVVLPLLRLVEEAAPRATPEPGNVVQFRKKIPA